MRSWLACIAFLVSACSQQGANPVAHHSATPSEQASPSAMGKPGNGPTPTPSTNLRPSAVDFSCRLPVMSSVFSNNYKGGFITFPNATFALDPAGGITYSNGVLTTDASPMLSGVLGITGPPFYDAARLRWLPAGSGQTTADGAFYAYTTWDPAQHATVVVHVVDVARAIDKTFKVAMPVQAQGMTVADIDSTGVYLLVNNFEQLPSGVWLMDRSTGGLRQLAQVGVVEAVRNGYAWAGGIDPRDPSPPQLRRSGTPSDRITRVDLGTGAQTTWFYRPGKEVDLEGFDGAGHPIAHVSNPGGTTSYGEEWLAADRANPVLINAGDLFISAPQGDGNRIWFEGPSGIYLYTSSLGLKKVAEFQNLELAPVGFCS